MRPSLVLVWLGPLAVVLVSAFVLLGCGTMQRLATPILRQAPATRGHSKSATEIPKALLLEARPIGVGPRFHPAPGGAVVGRCARRLGARSAVHVEVFAANRVVIVPAGIGVRPPLVLSAGLITGVRPPLVLSAGLITGVRPPLVLSAGLITGVRPPLVLSAGLITGVRPPLVLSAGLITGVRPPLVLSAGLITGVRPPLVLSAGLITGVRPPLVLSAGLITGVRPPLVLSAGLITGVRPPLVLSAGLITGVRPPLVLSAGRIVGARCYGALVTLEPTGVVLVRAHEPIPLSSLFRSWGQPLSPSRLGSFLASPDRRVAVFVNGRRWRGAPGSVPLVSHSEIVLEVGPHVPPHRSFAFPPRPNVRATRGRTFMPPRAPVPAAAGTSAAAGRVG